MQVLCRQCGASYDDAERWAICPHARKPARLRNPEVPTQPSLVAAGTARPSSPTSVFAEDFSLLIRTPRRMRIARSRIHVLS